jgi:iron complex outermembrane receptor protein
MAHQDIDSFRKAALAAGVLMCLGVESWAQETPEVVKEFAPIDVQSTPLAYRQFERVEITGSSIVRKEQTQALPIQVITRADIQKSGKGNVADYLQTLPVIFNSFSPALLGAVQSGFSGGAIHGQQIGTLVLINGRRLAGYGRQTSFGVDNGGVDLNALPLSAIERVEILTDGASSTYGTDAQAGVINIITRSERPGVEITVDHRMPDGQKGQSKRADLSVGSGRLARDGYSWYVTADLMDQQELLGRDRPYAAAGRYMLQQDGQSFWAYGPSLTAAQTSPTLATSKAAPWTRLWNADYQNGQCPEGQVVAWGQPACLDNTYAAKGLYPASHAVKLHAQGQLMLTSDITAYAELSWKKDEQRRTYNAWGQYSAKIGNTPGSPGYDLAVANGFDPAKNVWLLYSGSELQPTSRWYELQTRRLVGGLKGVWNEWDFNTSYYFSDNSATYSNQAFTAYPNLGVNGSGVLTNPALLSPLSDGSPLALQMQGMVMPRTVSSEGTNTQQGLDFKASRSIGEVDGRDVLLALGTDWRQEVARYNQYSSTGVPSYSGRRSIWAQFAELQLPLPHSMEALASLRNDHYSDFGNTTHGKLAAKWAPDDQWLLRGAWSTGFRAPAVAQMQETGKMIASTISGACNTDLLAIAARLGGTCPSGLAVYSQGSSQLKPELSTQWNLGLRYSPDRNQSLSLDYWRLDMKNKISNYYNFALINPLRYLTNFELNANKELQVYAPMANLGKTQTSGIDFAWTLRRPTDWGQLHMGVSGTWLLTSRFQRSNEDPFESDLGRYSYYSAVVVPKLRTRWHLGLQQASWQWQATVNHVGSYYAGEYDAVNTDTGKTVVFNNYFRVPAWWTADLMAVHQWSSQTSMRVGIENIFNRSAPLDFVAYKATFNFGTNPLLANVWGRTLNLSLTHRF